MNEWLVAGIIVGICFFISLYYGHRTKRAAHSSIDKYKEHVKELSYVEIEEEKEETTERVGINTNSSVGKLLSGIITLPIMLFLMYSILGEIKTVTKTSNSSYYLETMSIAVDAFHWAIPITLIVGVAFLFFGFRSAVTDDPASYEIKTKTRKVIRKY